MYMNRLSKVSYMVIWYRKHSRIYTYIYISMLMYMNRLSKVSSMVL